jgi:starvation-inducible DNA-binding protein
MSEAPCRTLARGMLNTPTGLSSAAVKESSAALTGVLADALALFVKTRNFHGRRSGPHLRDCHLLPDEQSAQIFAATDDMAERARKIGGTTPRLLHEAAAMTGILPHEADHVEAVDMFAELASGTRAFVVALREANGVCDAYGDGATASFINTWTEQAARRLWFRYEASLPARTSGHWGRTTFGGLG